MSARHTAPMELGDQVTLGAGARLPTTGRAPVRSAPMPAATTLLSALDLLARAA